MYKSLKWTQKEIENQKRPEQEMELVISNLPTNRSQPLMSSLVHSFKYLKKKYQCLYTLQINEKGTLLPHFLGQDHPNIKAKKKKNHKKRKLYINIPHVDICKTPSQNISKTNSVAYKKDNIS